MDDRLNLFYEEPDPDRWFLGDRYPRRIARRLLRRSPFIGGQRLVFLNLTRGLDRLGRPYRVNDYAYARKHPEETACIIGKPIVLDQVRWRNPIIFGTAVFSHPCDDPKLLERLPVKKVLVPGEWMRRMFEPHFGSAVEAWAVGIDTGRWAPSRDAGKDVDVLFYDKVLWWHDAFEKSMLEPLRSELRARGVSFRELRYGYYREEDFRSLLARSKAMLFICEHESQGIAYQQALSSGVPILAWDRGGYWLDPSYWPHKAQFSPVSSVPYWDGRCGLKFEGLADFGGRLDEFLVEARAGRFDPRAYIVENLTLEACARRYIGLVESAWQRS